MGRKKTDSDIALKPETWMALAKHLHPGGFVFAFGGPKTYHRLACALEDAGLRLWPPIVHLQAQGFPKATRPFKKPKKWREIQHYWLGWVGDLGNWILRRWKCPPRYYLDFIFGSYRYGLQALKPCTEMVAIAQKPYSGKPVESIVETGAGALNIEKARIGTAADHPGVHKSFSNEVHAGWRRPWQDSKPPEYAPTPQGRWPPNFALSHIPPTFHCHSCQSIHPIQPEIEVCPCGGELEFVEGCKRVGVKKVKGTNLHGRPSAGKDTDKQAWGLRYNLHTDYADPDGLETVTDWQCVKGENGEAVCPVEKLGEQSGTLCTHATGSKPKMGNIGYGANRGKIDFAPYGNDKGTCTRYYFQAGWEYECVEMCPVARLDEDAGERKSGMLDGTKHQRHTPKGWSGPFADDNEGPASRGVFGGDSGSASRFYHQSDFSYETAERLAQEDPVKYCPKAAKRERNQGLSDFYWKRDKQSPSGFMRISKEEWKSLPKRERAKGNIHPTVKPISLLKWLATLLLPPKEYAPRRLFVPFAGSGSEMIAALLVGWEEVQGCDIVQDYVDIANARIEKANLEASQLELPLLNT